MSNEVIETDNPITDDDLERLGNATRDPGDFIGRPLKFTKGEWTVHMGRDEPPAEVNEAERWIVDCRSYANGYVKWIDRKPLVRAVFRPVDGWIMPPKECLPDRDEERWPWDNKLGKGKDPWQETHQIVLKRLEHDEDDDGLVTWTATSYYGIKAMRKFVEAFVNAARKHPGLMPVVTLSTKSERSPSYGPIDAPLLTIVDDWQPFGDGASSRGSRDAVPQSAAMLMLRKPDPVEIESPANTIVGEVVEDRVPVRQRDPDDEIPF
jgi:hypothetical protein